MESEWSTPFETPGQYRHRYLNICVVIQSEEVVQGIGQVISNRDHLRIKFETVYYENTKVGIERCMDKLEDWYERLKAASS